ncbi:hypothetical protein DRP07_00295 [Archaeoglobales archaeon]|nr:MAG: hypothetical protein DRP07_00295 [Archaeoglobales archaeon]
MRLFAKGIDDDEKEMIDLAKKWCKALTKLPEAGLGILIRANGQFGGIIYKSERKVVDGVYRQSIHLVRPDGSLASEYLDYMPDPNGEPEDCQPFHLDAPFILTSRNSPGIDDDPSNFTWLILGHRASHLMRLRDDLIRSQNEIQDLNHKLEMARLTVERQKSEINALSEKVRILEEDVDRLSRENNILKESIAQLEMIAKEQMFRGYSAEKGLELALKRAEQVGASQVMGVREKLNEVLEMHKEIGEKTLAMSGGLEISRSLEEVLRRVEDLGNRLNVLQSRIEKQVGPIKAKEEESE